MQRGAGPLQAGPGLRAPTLCSRGLGGPGVGDGNPGLTGRCSQGVFSEVVSISNLGVARFGPLVEESGSLLLEYENGSACTTSDGVRTTYTTRIHLVCSRGSLVRRWVGRGPGPPGRGGLLMGEEGVSERGGQSPVLLFQSAGVDSDLGLGPSGALTAGKTSGKRLSTWPQRSCLQSGSGEGRAPLVMGDAH